MKKQNARSLSQEVQQYNRDHAVHLYELKGKILWHLRMVQRKQATESGEIFRSTGHQIRRLNSNIFPLD